MHLSTGVGLSCFASERKRCKNKVCAIWQWPIGFAYMAFVLRGHVTVLRENDESSGCPTPFACLGEAWEGHYAAIFASHQRIWFWLVVARC